MRAHALLLSAAVAACSPGGDAPPPPPPDEAEVPRAPVELLVERVSRAGVRSHYTMAPDGSRVAPFPGIPPDALAVVPSPDGATLALLRHAGGDVHLWLVDRDGAGLRPLLQGARSIHSVAWAPDGARLVLAQSTDDTTADLVVVNRDGTGERALTSDGANFVNIDLEPAWSPDGARIAFASGRSGTTRLWLVDEDGANLRQVLPSSTPSSERAPAWSGDGALLAFRASTSGGPGLGLVRPDGTGLRSFQVAAVSSGPAWSPDGRLLFSSSASGDSEVEALDLATGARTNLTHHRDHDLSAVALRLVTPAAWRGFAAAQRHLAGAVGVTALAAGDFVADGLVDLALLAPASDQVRLLRGTGAGAFQVMGGLGVAPGARGLAVGDVSSDGAADLLVLGAQAFQVFRGGAGGPGLPATYPLAGQASSLVLHDLDGDGSTEVVPVVAAAGAAPLRLPIHTARSPDGELVWTVDYRAEPAGVGQGCACDVSGEGDPDVLLVSDRPDAAVLLLTNQGGITLGEPVVAASGLATDAGTLPTCADLDGDRRADLVLLRPGAGAGGAWVLRSTVAGIGPPTALPVAGAALAVADLDRDGDEDLMVAGPTAPAAAFLRNLGDGRFARPVAVDLGGAPRRLVAADLDGDLWPDLAVADEDGSVAVLLNLGAAP